jgi:hypothetical protein
MRASPPLRFPGRMTSRRTLIAITTAAAFAAAAGPAHAGGSPPIPNDVKCSMTIKRKLPLAKVLRRGLPVAVTCTGAAKFLVAPDFDAMTKASQEYDHLYGAKRPAKVKIKYGKLTAAGTVTLRPRFTKVGANILRKFKRTRIIVGLGTVREDGRYWSSPGDWSYTTLIR